VNYYKHHIGDYRRDTAHLSLLEHGIYRQLMDTYYLAEEPIPSETELVMRRLSARTEQERAAVNMVLSEFFLLVDGAWQHARCDSEIAAYHKRAEASATNGKHGGRPPGKPKKTKLVKSRGATEKATTNHEPLTNNQDTPIAPKGAERFEDFWNAWPVSDRKEAKGRCLEVWVKAKAEPHADRIIAHVERLKASTGWTKNGGEFIPAPLVYLNQRKWEGAEGCPTAQGAIV
jgi:uncharacterized protein YdaU (DUF1376 family)